MLFKPDHNKPAQEAILSREKWDSAHLDIFFSDMSVERAPYQLHQIALTCYLKTPKTALMLTKSVLCQYKITMLIVTQTKAIN